MNTKYHVQATVTLTKTTKTVICTFTERTRALLDAREFAKRAGMEGLHAEMRYYPPHRIHSISFRYVDS